MIDPDQPANRSLMRVVQERSKDDPALPQRMTAKITLDRLLTLLKDDKGVHVETAFATLGALAGQACAEIAWQKMQARGPGPWSGYEFIEFSTTTPGQRYISGNWINGPLLEAPDSFCRTVLAGARHFGAADLPDPVDTVRHVAETLGHEMFGIPRLPEGYDAKWPPVTLMRMFGPHLAPSLTLFIPAIDAIPASLAFATQMLMDDAKDIIDPGLAALICIESAVPTSRIHPDDI